jgi:hypothetical protein
MAISGQELIRIGLPNESANSDSLYVAFAKTKNNFSTLFSTASPFVTFTGNTGISTSSNAVAGTVDITNTGVTSIIAGTGIIVDQANGNVTISSTGGGNGSGGTVTSVGVLSGTLTVSGSPIVSAGNITLNLPAIANVQGSYSYPSITVDGYGRITNIANGATLGTVTSVGVTTSGPGLQISGSPITGNGNINIINTGVTRLNAGSGISLSSSNGNITVSTVTLGGTVTSIGISSSTLNVTNSPITTTGTISVEIPTNPTLPGNVTIGNLTVTGNLSAGDITVSSIANGTSNVDIIGASGNVTISSAGNANILTVTGTGSNISGTLSVSGNANIGNIGTAGIITATGNIQGGNLKTAGIVSSTGNVIGGNLTTAGIVTSTGNVIGGNLTTAGIVTSTGNVIGGNLVTAGKVIASGSDDMTNGAAASLTVVPSYFSTTGAWTGTLAAGTEGQIKTFMTVAHGGNMVITVTNAGWKASGTGTITFSAVGQSCTLQYVNGKWFCIGNNGATFA